MGIPGEGAPTAATQEPRVIHESSYKDGGSRVQIEVLDGQQVITKVSTPESLRHEYDILSSIDDAGIPKLLSNEDELNNGRMTMEMMPGKGIDEIVDLNKHWESTPIEVSLAATITDQAARRLIGVRRGGYLYRDLNLSHLMVAQDAQGRIAVSLIDVEASEPLKDGVATVTSEAGTWETMSPEEFEVGGQMTEASNVYSLGVLLMQLSTGKNPYHTAPPQRPEGQGRDFAKFMHQSGIKFFPGEGTPLASILEKALDPDPNKRYQTIREFKKALQALKQNPGA